MAGMNNQRGKLKGKTPLTYTIKKVGNYLSKPGLILANVKPNADGEIEVEIPNSELYSHLQIFINDPMSCVSTEVSLTDNDSKFVDTRLPESKKEGFVYSDNRFAITLNDEGERGSVNDLNNTKYSILSSLEDVFNVQKLLGTYNNLNVSEFEKWSFLTKWNTLSAEEKLEKYREFMGHELNVFLYFKDVDFFSQYVSQHIEHKSSKELIDYFLIGDLKNVKNLMRINNLANLNILEIALGILLMKSEDPSSENLCKSYLKMLEEKFEIDKPNYEEKGAIFK